MLNAAQSSKRLRVKIDLTIWTWLVTENSFNGVVEMGHRRE